MNLCDVSTQWYIIQSLKIWNSIVGSKDHYIYWNKPEQIVPYDLTYRRGF